MAATSDSDILPSSIAHQTRFALRLTAALCSSSSSSSNAAFSPLSLHVALSLLAAGAGGATRDQLLAALLSGGGDDGGPAAAESLHTLAEKVAQLVLADGSEAGGPRIAFADAVFVDASLKLKPAFEDIAVGKYKAETHSVDFKEKAAQVAGEVNSWVEKVTSGLIKELLPPGSIDKNTRLVLANALYFKGAWAEKFDAAKTEDGEFHLLDGSSSVQVPFMSARHKQYIASRDNLKVLKLPYQQGGVESRQFSMYILLPAERDGLWSLAERLSSEPEFLEKHIPKWKVRVGQFKVPKFKISFGFEASGLLKGLGIHLPFSQEEADLSEFVDDSPVPEELFVSSVFHKSFVEVNEEGTEAAAASAVLVRKRSRTVPVDFIADHPFLFLIREDTTGVVLFVGHVVNPLLAT
ncbi:unnamed protein product [Urochloa humidicola]